MQKNRLLYIHVKDAKTSITTLLKYTVLLLYTTYFAVLNPQNLHEGFILNHCLLMLSASAKFNNFSIITDCLKFVHFYEEDPFFPLSVNRLPDSQRIVHFCFSAKGFSRLSGGWMRGSLVPFCVQYSFSLNGIMKKNNFNFYITATALAVK